MLQQKADYTDEDFMKDNNVLDVIMKGASEVMTNKLTADFYTALATTGEGGFGTTTFTTTIGYDAIVDAIADMNIEDESQLFLLVCPEWKGDIRKDADYKSAQMGEVVYNGQVGTVAGIPVIATKALTGKNVAYLLTKEAVTCFMKKDVEVEQNRLGEKRINELFFRTAYVIAITDTTKGRIIKAASK